MSSALRGVSILKRWLLSLKLVAGQSESEGGPLAPSKGRKMTNSKRLLLWIAFLASTTTVVVIYGVTIVVGLHEWWLR